MCLTWDMLPPPVIGRKNQGHIIGVNIIEASHAKRFRMCHTFRHLLGGWKKCAMVKRRITLW